LQQRLKISLALIFIGAWIVMLLSGSLVQSAEKLRFQPDDTIEQLREKIQRNGYNFQVARNRFSDMSPEMKERFFSRRPPIFPGTAPLSNGIGPLAEHLGKQLPTRFDWRDYNGHSYIGPVRDQGYCGSCYAFSACAAAEGTYNWATGRYDGNCADFSESYIIWCLGSLPQYSEHFFGCEGADYDYYELEALTVEGVGSEADFPYRETDPGLCTHWEDPTVVFRSWHRIPCNDIEAIKTAIMTYGVVDAAVYAGNDFLFYDSGIYEDANTTCEWTPCYYAISNHGVALVGWDDNNGDGYWILRNSFGTWWGEEGYMRIKYTSARVACAVTYLVYDASPLPAPDITANGCGGSAVISSDAPVSVQVSLDPGDYADWNADWWIAVHTPFASPYDWYSYVYPTGWMPGIHRCAQIPLFSLPPAEVLNIQLPAGNYIFYFAVDEPDGNVTAVCVDSVEVDVLDTPVH
jgi:C1A family cysteine protease